MRRLSEMKERDAELYPQTRLPDMVRFGGGNSISVLRTYYEWPWEGLFFKKVAWETGGKAVLQSISAFRNEPF